MRDPGPTTDDQCPARDVARFVDGERVALIAAWRERVLGDPRLPAARTMPESKWIDHAPVLLERLGAALEAACEPGASPEQLGHDAWQMPYARIHAEERFAHGYAIDEVLRELFQLRRVILETLAAHGVVLDAIAQQVIESAFAEAVATAASESARAQRGRDDGERDRAIGMVSHDLRNPLHAIRIGTDFLLAHGTLGQGERSVTERMQRSVDAMARMVADLLDVARMRGVGTLSIETSRVDLGVVLAQLVEETRAAYPSRLIELVAHGELHGDWDAARIAQGVSNLLSNALRYGDPSQPVRVTASGDEHGVRIDVWNAGVPIPEELLPRIFEPFWRGAHTGREGSGLGLYIAREIAAAHAGRLELESDAKNGTTVRWTLPRRGARSEPLSAGGLSAGELSAGGRRAR
ncbi:MAG: sensor histidine kinase [Myxococcota bacterium]|nr:sensor histidine kinase [Myxococcota bacterium]